LAWLDFFEKVNLKNRNLAQTIICRSQENTKKVTCEHLRPLEGDVCKTMKDGPLALSELHVDSVQAFDDLTTIKLNILRSKSYIPYMTCMMLFKETAKLDQGQGRSFTFFLKTLASRCGQNDLSSPFQIRIQISKVNNACR